MAGPSVKLFISCVSDEFGSYRDVLRKALTGPNVEVKIQEDFKALGGDTLQMLEDYIDQCEAVVHFIGDIAGSTPPATSVEDLLARQTGLQDKLARKDLTRAALAALTYTQWEAWLAIGFDKDLLIVAPAPGVECGPSYAPSDASRASQSAHLQRLKAIDRHPIEFTGADNLVAKIANSAVMIDALVRARAPAGYAKTRELLGAMIAATIAVVCLLAMFIAHMLPEEIPIFIRVLGAGTVGLFLLLAAYYWYILVRANEPKGSCERADYDALLEQLESGGTPAIAYRHWLTKALDRVDVFFGDPGRNDKSRFARMLGLETPGARWTTPAFDRCLWVALLYPIVTIIAVWAWSGHVGVAERALGLEDSLAGPGRSAYVLTLAIALYAAWRFLKTQRTLWVVVFVGATAVFTTVAGVNAASAVAKVVLLAIAGAFAPGARNAGVISFVGILAVAFYSVPVDVISSVASIVTSIGVIIFVSRLIDGTGRRGAFLALFFLAAMVVVFAGVFFASSKSWSIAGPILLVFGLLTLVNAPFDWFAIGLTRALLRRGLAPGGRGPFFYAVVDAITAVPVIAILSFVTVFTVQTFEDIAALRGGPDARIMPLDTLFAGLDLHPGDPEYWWLWLMLFSTLIPSALNLCIAAASLIRGLPFLNAWIVKRMQAAGSMRDSDRLRLASALSAQIAGGFLATGVALYLIGVWFLPRSLPILGTYVRNFSEELEKLDAPARIIGWFAGVP